ncbi:MAG: hypothetical protein K2O56_10855, partial [Muribaculaceae bacterium]|nr:hypothetical protein [Muribaculaceae bacterium]
CSFTSRRNLRQAYDPKLTFIFKQALNFDIIHEKIIFIIFRVDNCRGNMHLSPLCREPRAF